ncbi:MAG: M20 family metallopeptidase, partial [Planctomycetia bacterium]
MNDLIELTRRLISIPSVNPMGRNLTGPIYYETALTNFLEEWLRPLPIELRRQPVKPGRDNLLATYRAPNSKRHVLLEVHQDTVPVDGMTIDPFGATLVDGRIYGRGACDDKGPMAAMMAAFRRLVLEKAEGTTVTLALTVDEEHTFLGVSELVKQGLDGGGLKVDEAIVAEPTNLDIVYTHKGTTRWEIYTTGKACHSSQPHLGVNAIYRMAPVLASLERFAATLAQRPADPVLGKPTLSVGRIDGGMSVNTVPGRCRIEIDRRLIPGEDYRQAHAAVVEHLAGDP